MSAEETNDKVLSIIASLKKTNDGGNDNTIESSTDVTSNKNITEKKNETLRGKPKSGRFWKSQKEKFSTINKTKGLKQDFQKKTALRLELQRTKELAKQAMEQLKQKEAERKERRRQNLARSEENKRKAEIVQVITNTAKLKRMKKKQLRFIQKRDTNKQVEANK
ncbi:coiled-coil domain-containing protein 86 [Amyelois transitella]|uniref:coiled-coil domain-containing protein 86 n=1 Tax=Amyelois transitella TaxID=680683 RepID=UPI0029903269|nr:coiled-coil domain-containing protein 86 [Amyelois transitella]